MDRTGTIAVIGGEIVGSVVLVIGFGDLARILSEGGLVSTLVVVEGVCGAVSGGAIGLSIAAAIHLIKSL